MSFFFFDNTLCLDYHSSFLFIDTRARASVSTDSNCNQDDLTNLNIAAGQCVNTTVKQDVTFGVQGLPFGINLGKGKSAAGKIPPSITGALLAVFGALVFGMGV